MDGIQSQPARDYGFLTGRRRGLLEGREIVSVKHPDIGESEQIIAARPAYDSDAVYELVGIAELGAGPVHQDVTLAGDAGHDLPHGSGLLCIPVAKQR